MYEVSKHAKERYAERIMARSDENAIQRFHIENDEKAVNDINKMIQYGALVYEGRQAVTKGGRSNLISVYAKDCWIILVDTQKQLVITLYKVDLGAGDELNGLYVAKMLEKIHDAQKSLENITYAVNAENESYQGFISDNNERIKEYRSYIKNLEELNEGYQSVISSNHVKCSMADGKVKDIVNKLIGKKEF